MNKLTSKLYVGLQDTTFFFLFETIFLKQFKKAYTNESKVGTGMLIIRWSTL